MKYASKNPRSGMRLHQTADDTMHIHSLYKAYSERFSVKPNYPILGMVYIIEMNAEFVNPFQGYFEVYYCIFGMNVIFYDVLEGILCLRVRNLLLKI